MRSLLPLNELLSSVINKCIYFFRIRKNRGFYFEAGVRSIAISVSVRSHISQKPHVQTSRNLGEIYGSDVTT